MTISQINKFTMGSINASAKFLPANARKCACKAKPVIKIHQVLGEGVQNTTLHIFSDGSARELSSDKHVRNKVIQFTKETFASILKKYGSQRKFDRIKSDDAFTCFIRKTNIRVIRNTPNATIIKQGTNLNA